MDRFRSFVRRGLSLETFKFTLYLAIPAGITVALLYPGQVNRLVSHVRPTFVCPSTFLLLHRGLEINRSEFNLIW
jgi:hypothetical protein